MGHSLASLYRYASMGWPFTNGSCGSMNSLGARSVCELALDEVARAAKVLARPRNRGDAEVPEAMGDMEGKDRAGSVVGSRDDEMSEGNDIVGEVMGPFSVGASSVALLPVCSVGLGSSL